MSARYLPPPNQVLQTQREGPFPNFGEDQQPRLVSEYMRVLLRNRWLIAICALTGLILALLVSLSMRTEYEATARIAVELGNSDPLTVERPLDPGGTQISTKLETQLSILQSDAIGKNVIDDLKLVANCKFSKVACGNPVVPFRMLTPQVRADLLEVYHRGFHAELVPRTQILEVKFRSTDPRLAADIANAASNVDIYRDFRQRLDGAEKASSWLNGQMEDVKKQAEDAQARFVAYQKQVGIVGTDENHNVALNEMDELNRKLATVEAERIVKEAQYRVAVAGNPELIAAVAPESVIQTLRKQQAELRVQYAELTAKYDDNYPRVIQLRSELKDTQDTIDQEVRNIRERIEQEYEAARTSEQMLQAAVEKQKEDALQVDASAVQYALLQRDVQTSRDLYQSLVKKLKESGIDRGLRSSDLRLVDEAEIPTVPVRPRLPVNLTLGFFSGIMLAVATGFLRESFNRSIRTPNDVETECLLPALAIVPRLSAVKPKRGATRLLGEPGGLPVTLQQPESEAAEAYRMLRTAILATDGPTPRVICFVSARGKEGKSTSAVNTAAVLAQQGSRVLLVDADMRCPTIHTQLQLPPDSGLSECLSRRCLPTPIQIPDTTLFVLRAGARPPYISELLSSAQMMYLLHRWRYEYDFVIIDTPPVLAFTDGVIMAGLADATVLVVRSMTTDRQALWHVKQRLERAHAQICGVLLNDVRFDSFDPETFRDRRAYARYEGSMTA
jgi:succinoglycan biosynthesis transport protein ExoP